MPGCVNVILFGSEAAFMIGRLSGNIKCYWRDNKRLINRALFSEREADKSGRVRERQTESGRVREGQTESGRVREGQTESGRVREADKSGRVRERQTESGRVREADRVR